MSFLKEKLRFSFVIPVFNRPGEVKELLDSMLAQKDHDFEVVIVEDGSSITCEKEVMQFKGKLDVSYYYKPNSGPGLSRNYGCKKAKGNYYIILDSDCILPEYYFSNLKNRLENNFVDVFGGPDKAHVSFTNFQQAINYSMTSLFTTGGIRGSSESMDKFHPRSFNMGFSEKVFKQTKGFSDMRFGEDIDMSIRILNNNFKTRLFKDAYVYHKRRSTIKQFFKQIFNSGIARIQLYIKYPYSLKLVHFLPFFFVVFLLFFLIFSLLMCKYFIFPILFYIVLLFVDSFFKTKNLSISFLSVITSFIQLIAYGLGFFWAFWKSIILSKGSFSAFERNFYK